MVEVVNAICSIAAPNTRSRRQVFITLVCVPSIADALNECESDIRRDAALRSSQDFPNTFGVPQAGFSNSSRLVVIGTIILIARLTHGGAYRSALNRNTEMRYRIGDLEEILFSRNKLRKEFTALDGQASNFVACHFVPQIKSKKHQYVLI